jgi:hypothetical protein
VLRFGGSRKNRRKKKKQFRVVVPRSWFKNNFSGARELY